MLKLTAVGLVLALLVVVLVIARDLREEEWRDDYATAPAAPQDDAAGVKLNRKAAERGEAQANLGFRDHKSLDVVTKASPRESSSNISTAEVTLPAPEGASAIMPPPLAPKPSETMIKAPPRTLRTKSKAGTTPPKAKNGSQVPNSPKAIIAALPPAPARADLRVQLVAVKSKARAEKEAVRLTRAHKLVLDGLKIVFVRADLGKRGVFYRLRAGPLSDRASANSLCRKLLARKQGCIVIKP